MHAKSIPSHPFHPLSELCDACCVREPFRQEIFEAELLSRISKLKQEEIKTLPSINAMHDPVQKMPVEVVACIFEQASKDRSDDTDSIVPLGPHFGQICQFWRRVAFMTPSLWNEFAFIVDSSGSDEQDAQFEAKILEKQVENFRFHASRSRSLPMSVFIL